MDQYVQRLSLVPQASPTIRPTVRHSGGIRQRRSPEERCASRDWPLLFVVMSVPVSSAHSLDVPETKAEWPSRQELPLSMRRQQKKGRGEGRVARQHLTQRRI